MLLQKMTDFDEVSRAYKYIIDNTPDIYELVRWEYGYHPSDEMLRKYINEGAVYALKEGTDIAGIMVVTMYQGEDYRDTDWAVEAEPDEVAVVHLLGVNPNFKRQGVGTRLTREALEIAKSHGKKALRLDAIEPNIPAQKLYSGLGFDFRGIRSLPVEGFGVLVFYYYEMNLTEP
ncbi:MAG: GNAT family N-acetyltransferase [Lachnospiraceae bacterium]|nr:GNAT family N-acetyltransferase [Lachnospiraceae bacterium]